ncbi:hypothetical protein HYH03_006075 [Edaphochlamys debaryana]|uniref:Citrate transporter-like domain-containing protein n=1 Tax=Edaphochlamys debaryana TaxID=47281 RepID=A0A836C0H5_9CHLO|nr:hypothetical protein HYH03_006075 [Edaphochlamys debaryana]|eukprot:KAG2495836.1 hypothetical protein HYH03_006075 [Edaphochlamys debaryana]
MPLATLRRPPTRLAAQSSSHEGWRQRRCFCLPAPLGLRSGRRAHVHAPLPPAATNEDKDGSSAVRLAEPAGPDSGQVASPPLLPSNALLQSLEPTARAEASIDTQAASDQRDAVRLVGICGSVAALALATELNRDWIGAHQELAMGAVFLAGYTGIVVESWLQLSKAGVALLLAAALWSIRATAEGLDALDLEMGSALGEVSAVIFFLLGAMAVVEVVDSHQGFKAVTSSLRPSSRPQLLTAVALTTFFMSSVLDNLTTTIVMVALMNKLCADPDTRRFLGATVVVAANAGGAWTPIGDVTTTMLWIHGQITALPTMRDLLLPSAVSVAVPVAAWALTAPEMKDTSPLLPATSTSASSSGAGGGGEEAPPRSNLVLSVGLGSLLMVPVLRAWAGLPPHMGMLACLGFLWLVTDAIHFGEERRHLTVSQALKRVDSEAVLFFTGVLLAVAALERAGLLGGLAEALSAAVPQQEIVAGTIGLASAVVDNVPLVAATMGMYDMTSYPQDASLWQLIAYCAGTGGSLLIIGSAAGVAYMGMERSATFNWYASRITPWALAGYVAGLGTYGLQQALTGPH